MNHDFLYGVLFGMLVMLLIMRLKKLKEDVKQVQASIELCEGAIKEVCRHINGEVKHG